MRWAKVLDQSRVQAPVRWAYNHTTTKAARSRRAPLIPPEPLRPGSGGRARALLPHLLTHLRTPLLYKGARTRSQGAFYAVHLLTELLASPSLPSPHTHSSFFYKRPRALSESALHADHLLTDPPAPPSVTHLPTYLLTYSLPILKDHAHDTRALFARFDPVPTLPAAVPPPAG